MDDNATAPTSGTAVPLIAVNDGTHVPPTIRSARDYCPTDDKIDQGPLSLSAGPLSGQNEKHDWPGLAPKNGQTAITW